MNETKTNTFGNCYEFYESASTDFPTKANANEPWAASTPMQDFLSILQL